MKKIRGPDGKWMTVYSYKELIRDAIKERDGQKNLDCFHPHAAFPGVDLDTIPNAVAKLIATHGRRTTQYQWRVKCPYCGRKHHHGAGEDPDHVNTYLGHRVEHCSGDDRGRRGYYLVSVE